MCRKKFNNFGGNENNRTKFQRKWNKIYGEKVTDLFFSYIKQAKLEEKNGRKIS